MVLKLMEFAIANPLQTVGMLIGGFFAIVITWKLLRFALKVKILEWLQNRTAERRISCMRLILLCLCSLTFAQYSEHDVPFKGRNTPPKYKDDKSYTFNKEIFNLESCYKDFSCDYEMENAEVQGYWNGFVVLGNFDLSTGIIKQETLHLVGLRHGTCESALELACTKKKEDLGWREDPIDQDCYEKQLQILHTKIKEEYLRRLKGRVDKLCAEITGEV